LRILGVVSSVIEHYQNSLAHEAFTLSVWKRLIQDDGGEILGFVSCNAALSRIGSAAVMSMVDGNQGSRESRYHSALTFYCGTLCVCPKSMLEIHFHIIRITQVKVICLGLVLIK